ncbi:MAG TPA: sigma-70 family RNA polymerase sigma factor [Kofleriaceae bacterium]|nr:sigma-70 family RNA polymerase sigma factor [Kofleriaceae bacterium]
MGKEGDVERCYREYGHVVLRRAEQILGDREEAIDLMQELFTSLVKDPAQVTGGARITTWLYAASTRRCIERIRGRRGRARVLAHEVAPELEPSIDPRAEQVGAVRQLVGQMPDDLAQVTIFYFIDEMTPEEIAWLIGCSHRQVAYLLEQAYDFARAVSAA